MKMNDISVLVLNIDHDDIIQRRYRPETLALFDMPEHYNKIAICFMGYDHDAREIPEIPECKAWLQGLFERVPQLFFYMTPALRNCETIFLTLLDQPKRLIKGAQNVVFDIDQKNAERLAAKLVAQAIKYAESLGLPLRVAIELDQKFRTTVMQQSN